MCINIYYFASCANSGHSTNLLIQRVARNRLYPIMERNAPYLTFAIKAEWNPFGHPRKVQVKVTRSMEQNISSQIIC